MLKAYKDQGNATLTTEDSTMHFFAGLDAGRYGQMKTTVHNNATIGAQQPPKTVNEVYMIAANCFKTQLIHRPGQATTFVMTSLEGKPTGTPNGGKAQGGKGNGKYYALYAERLTDTRCHKCKTMGHFAYKCP